MFQYFKQEITLLLIVAAVSVVLSVAGILLLKGAGLGPSSPTPAPVVQTPPPALPPQPSFVSGEEVTIQGTVLEVDRSQMQIDGPAVVKLATKENREVRVLIEAEAVAVCKTSALPFPSKGDEIEVFGKAQDVNTLHPCDSPDHYIKILTPFRFLDE